MGESHSGYWAPPSQMEDVPIDNRHSENSSRSKSYYVKPKGNPCLAVTNHWDFFKRYKTSVFTAIISAVALLIFSAAMIYMSLQSTREFAALPVEPIVEDPVTEPKFFQDTEDAEEIERRDHIIRRYLYEVVPATNLKLKKREIQSREIGKEIFDDSVDRNPDKRDIDRRQKLTACQRNSEHCKSVLQTLQSMAKTAGENVNDLTKLIQQIRLGASSQGEALQYEDFLECIECGKITVSDSVSFVDTDLEDSPKFPHPHHHHHSQMKNMSAVSALLENSSSSSEETAEGPKSQETQKTSVTSTVTQKSGANVQKTVEVSKSKKLTDGSVVTQIIRNTTIIKTPEGKTDKETQEFQETSTQTGLNFDSLTPLRPRPTMQVVHGFGPTGPPVGPSNPAMSSFAGPAGPPVGPSNPVMSSFAGPAGPPVGPSNPAMSSFAGASGPPVGPSNPAMSSFAGASGPPVGPSNPAMSSFAGASGPPVGPSNPAMSNFAGPAGPPVGPSNPAMSSFAGASGPPVGPSNPAMSSLPGPARWSEGPNAGSMMNPMNPNDAPADPRFFQGPSEGDQDQFQPRILTGSQFQPSKANSDANQMIMPTAETMKSGQQVQYTPWMPYSVCYFGSPPAGGPPGGFKQTIPGMTNFPGSSPGAGNFPLPGNQFPARGSGFTSQGFLPMQFHQQQGVSYGPMPQFQPPNGFQQGQGHRVGPSGPGAPGFVPNFGNGPTGQGAAGRTPYYCTYVTAPTFQFPTIPGVSDFQRSADGSEVIEASAKQYGIPEPMWNGDASNYPGYPGDCDLNSHRCLDGSRCIPKNLWCDGSVDCPDASDETRCSCRDRIRKDRICDGYFDCPRGEDELGCFGCPPNSFSCEDWSLRYRNDNCVPLSQRCDGLPQCSNGRDEMDCAILTESYIENQEAITIGYTSGYLHKNWKGRWYPVCTRTNQWAIDACSSENDSPIKENPLIEIESTPGGQYHGPYLAQSQIGEIKLVPTCFNKAIHVICPEIPCGTRVLSQTGYAPFNAYEDSLMARVKNGTAGEEVVGVVGGRASQPKAWPFLVGVYKNGYFHCGGTIISDEWILTAAHCVDGFRQNYYEIQAGLLRRVSFSPMAQIRRAMYIKMHPRYDRKIMMNDLALIRLNERLRFNRWIRPTCLPEIPSVSHYWRNGPFPDTTCVTVGWGATVEHGPDPDHLREVEVPILRECKHPEDRNDAVICAGMPQGGRDACQGDSGGPLMCKHPGSNNQWYVAGVVSHGDGCARPNEPGAYTKVSQFVDWIEATMRTRIIPGLEPKPVEICPGFSCAGGLGKCLPASKRCDRTVNCLDAEDEMNCPMYKGYPPFRESSRAEENRQSNYQGGEIAGQFTPGFPEMSEVERKTNRDFPGGKVDSATSQDINSNSVFTIGVDGEENSATTGESDAIAPRPSSTRKNDTDATSWGDPSTERPPIGTTSEPQSSTRRSNEIGYAPRFTCTRVLQSIAIGKRCDRVLDCEDGTDEDHCSCRDYLANLQPIAICDGHVDCHDGSDEENCAFAKENEFVCSRSGKCIPQSKMCDHHIDCPYMEDELDCFTLTNGHHVILDLDKRPHLNLEGVVTQRKNGKWRPACQKHNKTVQARIANEFCVYFGFGAAESIDETPVLNSPIGVRQSTKDNIIPYEYPPSYLVPEDPTKTCLGLYVRCKPILSANTSSLIATTPKNDEISYLLPWQAQIFVDGRYHCPAILLEYSWLLASSRCAEGLDLRGNYTMALLGASPTYLHVDGPNEQKIPIDSIKTLSKMDAAMMHLERPVNMTRYVQPIFLEKKIFPASSKDLCVATGVDKNHRPRISYLRPVQNCPACRRCYVNATSAECRSNNTSSNWSGTVVCRGSGGWYPAAIFDSKDLPCGFQSPQTLGSIDYGYADFTEISEKELQPTKGPNCEGLRCPLGKCVPWTKVCDGVDDCRDGSDESAKYCEKRRDHCKAMNGIGCQCAKSELRCANGQCVPKEAFCNGANDCDDHSDEPATCNCAAYLRLTAPDRLCDNVRHCVDKSDESDEKCLCKDASFKCTSGHNVTETCVAQDFVCDGEADCANGEDEKTCRTVKGTLKDPPGTGEVLRRSFGVWHSECFPMPISTDEEISEVCRSMGYKQGRRIRFEDGENPYGAPLAVKLDEFYMIRLNSRAWISTKSGGPLVSLAPVRETCHRAFVKCT